MTNIGMSTSPGTASTMLSSPWTKVNEHVIETTRRGNVCCKSCDALIDAGRLRVGVFFRHMNGFSSMNWHHIECYLHARDIDVHHLEGFGDLDASHQQFVQQLAKEAARYHAMMPSTCSA